MKYEMPKNLSEEEIVDNLKRSDLNPGERTSIVLSALYYGKTVQFSGDILLQEFSKASYPLKYLLKNLFETYHDMCRTDYRIQESISLLEVYKIEKAEHALEIDAILTNLKELLITFHRRKPRRGA